MWSGLARVGVRARVGVGVRARPEVEVCEVSTNGRCHKQHQPGVEKSVTEWGGEKNHSHYQNKRSSLIFVLLDVKTSARLGPTALVTAIRVGPRSSVSQSVRSEHMNELP